MNNRWERIGVGDSNKRIINENVTILMRNRLALINFMLHLQKVSFDVIAVEWKLHIVDDAFEGEKWNVSAALKIVLLFSVYVFPFENRK